MKRIMVLAFAFSLCVISANAHSTYELGGKLADMLQGARKNGEQISITDLENSLLQVMRNIPFECEEEDTGAFSCRSQKGPWVRYEAKKVVGLLTVGETAQPNVMG